MKKIIKLLSIISLTTTSSLSVLSCSEETKKEIQIPKLTLAQEKNDIINAINLKNINGNKVSDLKADDITMVKDLLFDGTNLSYDITIKQDAKTFLNKNFNYRIPEVSGNFDISNNKITNNEYESKYLIGKNNNFIDDTGSILSGTTNDFTLITNSSFWTQFNSWIFYDFNGGANPWLKSKQLWNSNITLTNSEWKSIILQLKTDIVPNGYAACIHITRKPGSNFQIAYTNLTIKDRNNMPLPQNSYQLPLIAFKSNNDIEDGSIITNNNKFITLNKNILSELKDIYNSKLNNKDYGNNNWNVNSISKILEISNYSKTNLDYNTISECIYNSWNINIVNNFLIKNYYRTYRDAKGQLVTVPINFLTLQYDKDNNYIKNNLNI